MRGFSCWVSALRVGDGIELRLTNRTASPERAAQAAAGIANSGFSPEATTTSDDGFPRATLVKWSTFAAIWYGSSPFTTVLLSLPGGGVLSPTRIAWVPLGTVIPFGFRRSSVCEVTAGIESPSVNRIGARTGAADIAPAAITPCQSSLSASTTAGGRVEASPAGNSAEAMPAASATG